MASSSSLDLIRLEVGGLGLRIPRLSDFLIAARVGWCKIRESGWGCKMGERVGAGGKVV